MKMILLNCIILQVIYIAIANRQNFINPFYGSSFTPKNSIMPMGCFSDYILKSKEISEGYSQDYNKCLLDATEDHQSADDKMQDKRLTIVESSRDICMRLSMCDSLNTTLEIFRCHALIGANNTRDVYSISGNASEYASILQEHYRQIDLRQDQCCKASERKYVEATGSNYRILQGCLEGRTQPSSLTETTTASGNILNSSNNDLNEAASPLDGNELEAHPKNLETTTLQLPEQTNSTL